MGRVFPYIADRALVPASEETYHGTCQYCGTTGVDVYEAHGYLLPPTQAVRQTGRGRPVSRGERSQPSADGESRYAACKACLLAGRVAHIGEWSTDEVIAGYVTEYLKGRPAVERRKLEASLRGALRRTPRVPLFLQYDDWPLCCGDLTEFTGSPKNWPAMRRLRKAGRYWERGVSSFYDGFGGTERIRCCTESPREVSRFRCLACGTIYWTFQFT